MPDFKNFRLRFFSYLVLTAPLLIYFFSVLFYAVNIPFWDEFDAALNWLLRWKEADFSGRFSLMVHQHNEHRMFSYYALVLINYLMMGEINFRLLIIAGNLGIIFLLLLLYRLLPVERRSLLYFVPVLLLVTPPMSNITDLGVMTMNGIFQYFFALFSLWFLSKNRKLEFLFAIFFAILATFSHGNGMFVYLSGYVVMLLSGKKSKFRISVWSMVMVLSVTGYFTHYVFHTQPSSAFIVFKQPVESLMFFFAFFANNFYVFVGKQLWPVIAAGGSIVVFYGCLVFFRWKYLKQYPVTISAMVFILLSVAAVAVSRVGMGIEEATADRYRLLSALFLALLCISVFQGFQKIEKWVLVTLLTGSLLFYAGRTVYGFYKLDKQKTMLTDGMKTFAATGKCPKTLYPDIERGTWILKNSIRQNIFSPPNFKSKVGELSGEKGLGK